MIPGEYRLRSEEININQNRETLTIIVSNTGDRPVQVGSHYHFAEVNRELLFKRDLAIGKRLNIPAGTAVRFEPGEEKEIELCSLAGAKKVYGLNNLTDGSAEDIVAVKQSIVLKGFKTEASQ